MQSSPAPQVPMLQTPPQPSGAPQAVVGVQSGRQQLPVFLLHSSPIDAQASHGCPQLSGEAQLVVEQVEVQHMLVF
jgi:hypothetical protein